MTYNSSQIFNHQSKQEVCNSQIVNTTEKFISGSEIIYTPESNTDFVVYEFSFCQTYHGVHSKQSGTYYLQTGSLAGSYEEVEGYICHFACWQQYGRDLKNICFVIPSWEGPKKLRITGDVYGTDRTFQIHKSYGWEGSTSTHKEYSPSLEVYSIRNVD